MLADRIEDERARARFEADWIRKALAATDGNRTHAAKLLEISHRALLYKLKAYGITTEVRASAVSVKQ